MMSPPHHVCSVCQKQYSKKSNLLRHDKAAHSEKRILCEQCDKAFKRKYLLTRHMNHVHGEGEFLPTYCCDLCPVSYKRQDQLNQHIKLKHSNNKPGIALPSTLNRTVEINFSFYNEKSKIM